MALLESYVAQPPPLRELENGAVRIAGTRVSLDSVIICYNQGYSAEEIAMNFSTLKLRDVYAVIAYYLDNKESVEAYLARQEEAAQEIRRQYEALRPPDPDLRARLLARLAAKEGS